MPETLPPEVLPPETLSPGTLPPESPPADADPPSAPPSSEPGEPVVAGVSLLEVRGFQDLPEDAQTDLARRAELRTLEVGEEINAFGVALVVAGAVSIMPTIADQACAVAKVSDVVFTDGSLRDAIQLRVVAKEPETRVAIWDSQLLQEALKSCPWVEDDLRRMADEYQALAGATLGPMGERLDETLRGMVTSRCSVRLLNPSEVLVEQGGVVDGMYVVGVGALELEGPDGLDELGPGDFLFPEQVMGGGRAPATARAGDGGALVLCAPRLAAHELLVVVPPLLEILAG